jgi:G3E family GTPase
LLARRDAGTVKAFDRIVIETTGLADPAPVLHALVRDEFLLNRLRLEGVITVVDGVNGWATLDAHPEALKQVAVADRIVLTKLDLLHGIEGEDKMFAIIGRLRNLNPTARLLTTHRGEANAERLFNMGMFNAATKSPQVQAWLNDEALAKVHRHHHDVSRHDAHIRSFSLRDDRAISPEGLEIFFAILAAHHGENLLRLKGVIKLSDDPTRPLVVHGVQHVFHPPLRLSAWPDGKAETRMVFIVRDIPKATIEELFHTFTDQLSGDAMTDKTLSLVR